jgi:hypothetical protein
MDTAEGSKLQIPRAKSQKVLTTDCTDSTDENHCSFVVRRIRFVRVRNVFGFRELRFAWHLELGAWDFARQVR